MGRLAVAALAIALGLGACSSDSDSDSSGSTTTTTMADTGGARRAPTPASSPEAAVAALLAAEQRGDHDASYLLVSPAGRKALDAGAWARLRNQLPAITGVKVEAATGGRVVAAVDHEPGLDPFLGLTPARERQTWTTTKQGDGWVVNPEPLVEPEFPAVALAQDAALAWARAVQACDERTAKSHEGVAALFGPTEAAAGLCGSRMMVAVGAPETLRGGPDSQALVAQYGPEALVWAKAVAVTGGARPFSVVLAPIGSVWKVVAVFAS